MANRTDEEKMKIMRELGSKARILHQNGFIGLDKEGKLVKEGDLLPKDEIRGVFIDFTKKDGEDDYVAALELMKQVINDNNLKETRTKKSEVESKKEEVKTPKDAQYIVKVCASSSDMLKDDLLKVRSFFTQIKGIVTGEGTSEDKLSKIQEFAKNKETWVDKKIDYLKAINEYQKQIDEVNKNLEKAKKELEKFENGEPISEGTEGNN